MHALPRTAGTAIARRLRLNLLSSALCCWSSSRLGHNQATFLNTVPMRIVHQTTTRTPLRSRSSRATESMGESLESYVRSRKNIEHMGSLAPLRKTSKALENRELVASPGYTRRNRRDSSLTVFAPKARCTRARCPAGAHGGPVHSAAVATFPRSRNGHSDGTETAHLECGVPAGQGLYPSPLCPPLLGSPRANEDAANCCGTGRGQKS